MKVYLVWHSDYSDDVLCVFDSKEKAASYILRRAECASVSVEELMEAEMLIVGSNDDFYTDSDYAPEYNPELYTIDEYEVNQIRGGF